MGIRSPKIDAFLEATGTDREDLRRRYVGVLGLVAVAGVREPAIGEGEPEERLNLVDRGVERS